MKTLTPPASAISSLSNFLEYRDEIGYNNERLKAESLGIQRYHRRTFRYPKQSDDFWKNFDYQMVNSRAVRFFSGRRVLFLETVVHYLYTPMLASPLGNSSPGDVVPSAFYLSANKTVYLDEGAHRAAAALIAGRPLLMRLAPLSSAE